MKLYDLIKTGFGLGLGFNLSTIIFNLIGIVFIMIGLSLLQDNKKDEKSNRTKYIGGMSMLVIGVVFLGGIGLGLIVDNL